MEKREQDVPFFWMEDSNEQLSVPLKLKKKVRPKKMEFIGWGSKPLIEFLRYIGKDTCKQLSQYEVTAIINEYVNRKNLLHPGKKKRVVCDDWLHSIFGRKSVPRIKFYDLLESHLAENHDESEDDLLYSSDGEENMACKKQKMSSSDKKTPRQKKQVPETPKSCFAAIISENIKLLYLKRSLVQDLLKDPESFEGKVVGSYVRIKSDPNDYFQKNSHQLLQVTGVRKAYGSGDVGTENFLQVPNLLKDIRICMLSDDNFSEEECEDLRQRVKAGLLERPTVVEFEQKAQILHEDITKHWLVRELALLQNLIDRANEKGWRKELFEYLERKQLLETPSERSRLLLEVPKVIADELEPEATLQDPAENVEQGTSSPKSILREASNITIDVEANQTLSTQNSGSLDASGVEEAAIPSEVTFCNSSVDGEGNRYFINGNTSIKEPDGIQAAFETCKQDKKMGPKDAVIPSQVTFCNISVDGKGNRDFINGIMSTKQPYGIQTAFEMCKQDKNMEEPSEFVQQQKKFSAVIRNASSGEMQPENSRENMGLKGMTDMQTTASQVIELSDDDEEVENPGGQVQIVDHSNSSIWHHYMNPQGNIQGPLRNLGGQFQIVENPDSSIWHYMDPQGNIQGPFSMTALKRWSDAYYFQPGFKIWKRGQSQDKAVLLSDMLRLMFPI